MATKHPRLRGNTLIAAFTRIIRFRFRRKPVFRSNFLELTMALAFIIAPFSMFLHFNHPKKGLSEVMLPASVTEKYVTMQLICLLAAPLSVFILFGAMDSLLAFVFPKIYGGFAVAELFKSSIDFDTFMILLLLQQFIFFFNLLFVSRKVVKTFGVFILANILFTALFVTIISILSTQIPFADGESMHIQFDDRGLFDFSNIAHPIEIVTQIFKIIFILVMPISLMIGSYFVMKNKRY